MSNLIIENITQFSCLKKVIWGFFSIIFHTFRLNEDDIICYSGYTLQFTWRYHLPILKGFRWHPNFSPGSGTSRDGFSSELNTVWLKELESICYQISDAHKRVHLIVQTHCHSSQTTMKFNLLSCVKIYVHTITWIMTLMKYGRNHIYDQVCPPMGMEITTT